jgi:hypothetical protein
VSDAGREPPLRGVRRTLALVWVAVVVALYVVVRQRLGEGFFP